MGREFMMPQDEDGAMSQSPDGMPDEPKKEFCLRCGKTELKTEADKQTGVCADCWMPEDNMEGDNFPHH